jgi:hypothetical protein
MEVIPMATQGYVSIPGPTIKEYGPDWPRKHMHLIGDKVRDRSLAGPHKGQIGKVIGWGRSMQAQRHHVEQHVPVLRCEYGKECDYLCDEEGPVVQFGGDLSEDLDWYPGQACGALEGVMQ